MGLDSLPTSSLTLADGRFLHVGARDDHRLDRHILHLALRRRFDLLYLIDHIHSAYDATEDRVAPAAGRGVQMRIVGNVDEEMRGRAVRVAAPPHRHRSAQVFEAVLRFVFNRRVRRLLHQIGENPPRLDHEVRDDAVKDGPIIKSRIDVVEEILGRFRRLPRQQGGDGVHSL